jgi:hypothetical protein
MRRLEAFFDKQPPFERANAMQRPAQHGRVVVSSSITTKAPILHLAFRPREPAFLEEDAPSSFADAGLASLVESLQIGSKLLGQDRRHSFSLRAKDRPLHFEHDAFSDGQDALL